MAAMKEEALKNTVEENNTAKEMIADLEKQNEELRARCQEMTSATKTINDQVFENNSKNTEEIEESILKSRDLVEKQLSEMIKAGEADPHMVGILVKIYANMVNESDFVTDPHGVLKVSDECFLKYINQEDLNQQQEIVGRQIVQAVYDKLTKSVLKNARRLSISLKRKPEIEEQGKEIHRSKHTKKGKHSPKHKK